MCYIFKPDAPPIFFPLFFLPFPLPYSHSPPFLPRLIPLSFFQALSLICLFFSPFHLKPRRSLSSFLFFLSSHLQIPPLFLCFLYTSYSPPTLQPFFLFSALFSTPAEVICWVDVLLFFMHANHIKICSNI